MRLAPLSALAASHARTEASAWVYKCPTTGDLNGVLLNLPLTAEGEIALVLGKFNTADPDPEHLCAPGDQVSAMYIWFTGGRGLRARNACRGDDRQVQPALMPHTLSIPWPRPSAPTSRAPGRRSRS